MASSFEKTLREQVKEIAKRLEITESRAFAVWYGKVALRLNEKEALEAASFDGGNDRGTDFFFVDDEWERVIIVQWKFYASSNKTPTAGDLTQLFHVYDELSDPQDLRDEGRDDLAEASEALAEARRRNYALDLRFLYPGKRHKDRDRDPNRLIRNFNRKHRNEQITAQLVRLNDLEIAYGDFQGSADRVQKGTLDLANGEFLEEKGPHGKYLVATVPGSSLAALFEEHGNRLFDQNVRLFLGSRKGSVNAGISETLGEKTERGNFWAYNNGITILARGVEPDPENEHLNLTEFSIVNGCQTTVSIANASETATKEVAVVARIIEAEDPDLIEKVIRFTNSQTPINVWDIKREGQAAAEASKATFRAREAMVLCPATWRAGDSHGSGKVRQTGRASNPSLSPQCAVSRSLQRYACGGVQGEGTPLYSTQGSSISTGYRSAGSPLGVGCGRGGRHSNRHFA